MQHREALQGENGAQHRGEKLGKHRGPRGPRHPHAEGHDEHDVQHDVQEGGENEEDEGRSAVPQGPQQVGDEVIENRGPGAQKDDEQIGKCHIVNVFRCVQKAEDGVSQHAAHRGEQDGEQNGEQGGGRHAAAHPRFVLRTEQLPQPDAEAAGQPLNEAEDEIDDGAGGPHGGQRVRADGAAYDHRVRQGVEKLKQISADNGQGKAQQDALLAARGQVFGHKGSLLSGKIQCRAIKSEPTRL